MGMCVYEAVITPSDRDGWFEVEIPDIGAVTQGTSLSDAAYMAQDALQLMVSVILEAGEKLPKATFGRTAPEGGYVMVVPAELAVVPEVPEMSVEEAADLLDVSKARVYAMCREGVLESRKVGVSVMVSTESVRRRVNGSHPAGRPRREPATA